MIAVQMLDRKHLLAGLVAAVSVAFSGAAQAQLYIQSYQAEPPLYPYTAQPQYIYPVPQYPARAYPYVRSTPAAPVETHRAHSKVDPELVEELRNRKKPQAKADEPITEKAEPKVRIDKTIVVREKPIVRKHYRVVDDPPVVVTREIDENGVQLAPESRAQLGDKARVIHAEAEVTILGPDRMSIRLYRKSDGSDANAKVVRKNEITGAIKGRDKTQK